MFAKKGEEEEEKERVRAAQSKAGASPRGELFVTPQRGRTTAEASEGWHPKREAPDLRSGVGPVDSAFQADTRTIGAERGMSSLLNPPSRQKQARVDRRVLECGLFRELATYNRQNRWRIPQSGPERNVKPAVSAFQAKPRTSGLTCTREAVQSPSTIKAGWKHEVMQPAIAIGMHEGDDLREL